MLQKILCSVLMIVWAYGYGQDTRVVISEKKTGKRVVLFAENTTKDTLNVYFMVHAEGYRRSGSRPILKNIPPETKTAMITLIELANVPSSYTYEVIVNKGAHPVALEYENEAPDIASVLDGKLVVFTLPNCEKCQALTAVLIGKRTPHRAFNINEDPVLYRQFMSFIKDSLTTETRIRFPVVWNKDRVIFGYEDLGILLQELQITSD